MPDRAHQVAAGPGGAGRPLHPLTARSEGAAHEGAPSRLVIAAAVLTAVWCLGFAAVNVTFEVTDRFAVSHAAYASGLAVLDWFVAALKVLGAATALASVRRPARLPAQVVTVALWGAFSTLALYVSGSLVEAAGMVTGLAGSADQISAASIVYLGFFLVAAIGFGILAVSHARRTRSPKLPLALGIAGAPAMLALILVAIPALLVALGVFPG